MSFGSGPGAGTGGGSVYGGVGGSVSIGTLRISSIASTTVRVLVNGYSTTANGRISPFRLVHTPNTDRTAVAQDTNVSAGGVVALNISTTTSGVKRGQCYVAVHEIDTDGRIYRCFARGYVYSDGGDVTLGQIVESGPGGGEGFKSWVTLASNVAGNVTTNFTLAVANTVRLYHGYVWYINAVGAATRSASNTLFGAGLALPTGFAGSGVNWVSPTLTLTDTEEGGIFVLNNRFLAVNDATAMTYANNSTAPVPFPYWTQEDDLAQLQFLIGSGAAGDTYSAYALVEEWLVL